MLATFSKSAGAIAPALSRKARPNTYATLLQNPYAEAILRDFSWLEYMRAQPDLTFANEQDARWHLVYNGYREGRLCDLGRCNRLDPAYYRQRYGLSDLFPICGIIASDPQEAHRR